MLEKDAASDYDAVHEPSPEGSKMEKGLLVEAAVTFRRYAPGLYVDSTNSWVITRDVEATGSYKALYTIRECIGFGPLLDGVTMFPDYGDIIRGEYHLLAECKADIEQRIAS